MCGARTHAWVVERALVRATSALMPTPREPNTITLSSVAHRFNVNNIADHRLHADHRQRTLNTSGVHLWLILWKAYRALSSIASASIRQTGLCGSDFRVLDVLLHKGPLPVNTIGPIAADARIHQHRH